MNIVPILCLLFVVARADNILNIDARIKRESRLAPNGLDNTFLDIINPGHTGRPISGRFVYDGDAGQYEVFYFADAYGYQAQGRLIQASHPISNLVQKWSMRITLMGKYGSVNE